MSDNSMQHDRLMEGTDELANAPQNTGSSMQHGVLREGTDELANAPKETPPVPRTTTPTPERIYTPPRYTTPPNPTYRRPPKKAPESERNQGQGKSPEKKKEPVIGYSDDFLPGYTPKPAPVREKVNTKTAFLRTNEGEDSRIGANLAAILCLIMAVAYLVLYFFGFINHMIIAEAVIVITGIWMLVNASLFCSIVFFLLTILNLIFRFSAVVPLINWITVIIGFLILILGIKAEVEWQSYKD